MEAAESSLSVDILYCSRCGGVRSMLRLSIEDSLSMCAMCEYQGTWWRKWFDKNTSFLTFGKTMCVRSFYLCFSSTPWGWCRKTIIDFSRHHWQCSALCNKMQLRLVNNLLFWHNFAGNLTCTLWHHYTRNPEGIPWHAVMFTWLEAPLAYLLGSFSFAIPKQML